MRDEKFDILSMRYLDDDLSDAELLEFADALRESRERRQQWVELCLTGSLLSEMLSPEESLAASSRKRSNPGLPVMKGLAVADWPCLPATPTVIRRRSMVSFLQSATRWLTRGSHSTSTGWWITTALAAAYSLALTALVALAR